MGTRILAALAALALGSCKFDTNVDFEASADQDASLPTRADAALPGMALSFDGTNDVVRLSRRVADDFTLEAWIRTTKSRGGSRFFDGLGLLYADVSGGGSDFGASILNDHFCFGTGFADLTIESSTIVTNGDWFHVAAVRTRSTGIIRVLVNGTEEASVDTENTLALDASSTIDIGGNVIDSRYFEGTIDEVRIWDVARTNEEIQQTMKTSLDGSEANLVGYYNFDSDEGQTKDATTSLNHGELGLGDADRAPSYIPSDVPLQ